MAKGYADIAAMRERIRQAVVEELGEGVRVYVDVQDPRARGVVREVRVEVVVSPMTPEQVENRRGKRWEDN